MTKERRLMTEVLKEALAAARIPHAELERKTGVKRASIMRFMRGETSLRLDLADRLAQYLGIEVRWRRRK